MTQRVLVLVALPIAVLSIQGCSTLSLRAILTRTEQDTYTITTRDTTHQIEYRNAPGQRGIIYPSDRTITATRRVEQYDSTVERHYPNFIRFGCLRNCWTCRRQHRATVASEAESSVSTSIRTKHSAPRFARSLRFSLAASTASAFWKCRSTGSTMHQRGQ